jgi:hypothetical protein
MNTKTQTAKTDQVVKSAQTQKNPFEVKMANFQKANNISKQITACKNHLEKLHKFGEENTDPNTEENRSITLYFSDNHSDRYEIVKTSLVQDISEFLIQKLETKIKELETEFLKIEL